MTWTPTGLLFALAVQNQHGLIGVPDGRSARPLSWTATGAA